ncbi:MAG: Mu-like prophage major head subunit gpT family protein [Pseudomonadota bacterium]
MSNPNLSDGNAVYSTTRGNLASTASGITITALSDARQAMRLRKGLDGVTLINAEPRYMVVGADRETEAQEILASITPNTTGDVNVFSGSFTLLVEPRIQDGSWFLFADPGRLPVMQYSYLESAPGVQVEQMEQWNTLGTSYRAWLDFGSGFIDWRGAHKNEVS